MRAQSAADRPEPPGPRVDGGSFYDAGGVLDRYVAHRAGVRFSPNHVMEEPAVLRAIGDPTGLRILDLGCGDAAFGRQMLSAGAADYLGIDNSRRMLEAAVATLAGTSGRAQFADLDTFAAPRRSVDVVTARLCLHYLPDLDAVIARAAAALTPTGRLIVTVVHPVITSYDHPHHGPRTNWTVDDYFDTGLRLRPWMGSMVTWHHRTVADYVTAITTNGLALTSISECPPDPMRLQGHPDELARRRRVPLFLLLTGQIALSSPAPDLDHVIRSGGRELPSGARDPLPGRAAGGLTG